VAAGVTTVEGLADMTPEQLEEIPGIGEKTLEKISIAVRHYFGHFEEGEGEAAETGAADTGNLSEGDSEVSTAPEAVDTAEAELENAAVVLEEAESTRAAEAEDLESSASDELSEELAGEQVEEESLTAAELAVENVPAADEAELPELEAEENEDAPNKEDGA